MKLLSTLGDDRKEGRDTQYVPQSGEDASLGPGSIQKDELASLIPRAPPHMEPTPQYRTAQISGVHLGTA